ncbi:MAG: long-chain fatty acid--CoA ligase [Candidatus Eisenbacteria bacterium]|nr:long-chain fatty acid--CoA ligase [Candidatus Eisenbacteria bacterium]
MAARTLIGIFLESVDSHHRADQFMRRGPAGWESIPAERARADVERLMLALRELGVERGDRVALLAENRYEWALTDLAVLALAAVTVPIYPTLIPEQCATLLADSGAKAIVVSSAAQLDKIRGVAARLPALGARIVMDDVAPADPPERTFASLLARGETLAARSPATLRAAPALREAAARVAPEDLATIIYTAGTTGEPKGAMLTHDNIASNVHASMEVLRYAATDRYLSFLPLSHVFERMAGFYATLACGAGIAYADSIDTVGRDALEVHPTILCGVPRFYEKVRARILEGGRARPAVERALFGWGLARGLARVRRDGARRGAGATRSVAALDALADRLADRIVLARIRERLGGRLRFGVSGSAPLAPEVIEFFDAMGIPIIEGYGLTETSPVICINPPGRVKRGTVGPPIPGVEVKIGDEGEILTRGPHVMRGYYHDEAATREALRDGWFHTGDIGRFDEDGYLMITDRLKDVLVLAGGKKVAPQPIEARLKNGTWVTDAILLGDRRPYVVALIVPDFAALEAAAAAAGNPAADRAALIARADVRTRIEAEIERVNAGLARFEQIKRFALIERELSLAAGELTPKLSIKRAVVAAHFAAAVESLYAGHVSAGAAQPAS